MKRRKTGSRQQNAPPALKGQKRAARSCGLCGKGVKLTRAECCDQWICDDEDEYVLFSYARNSCHRNHSRHTLCASHYNEGHEGTWQECGECREGFETEMYVWYRTNEHNFVKLENPPKYEPTKCAKCRRVIKPGEDGYSMKDGKYYCERCTGFDLSELFSGRG